MTAHHRGCSDEQCAESYALPFGEAKFYCQGCERWCGYCMGCVADDMPELCDDCAWHVATWRNYGAFVNARLR